jgi:hypothetical protein
VDVKLIASELDCIASIFGLPIWDSWMENNDST